MKIRNIFKVVAITVLILVIALGTVFLNARVFAPKAEATKKTYAVGDVVEFGSYPQSRVVDSTTVLALDEISKDWMSYDYYSGDGYGSMVQGDWMKYADITYNNEKYRAVTFSQYRVGTCNNASNLNSINQSDNGYVTNRIYYFKYEPIEWIVLDPEVGLVLCRYIIDCQAYSNTVYNAGAGECYNDINHTNYANDYATSSIRRWLNDDFYNTAFSASQKSKMVTTELDNRDYIDTYREKSGENTCDKVFLLSWSEMQSIAYGFTADTKTNKNRRAEGTDYAKCQGLFVSSTDGCSGQLLRSAGYGTDDVYTVKHDGKLNDGTYGGGVSDVCYGTRPALKFSDLSSDILESDDTVDVKKNKSNGNDETGQHIITGKSAFVLVIGLICAIAAITIVAVILGYKKKKF